MSYQVFWQRPWWQRGFILVVIMGYATSIIGPQVITAATASGIEITEVQAQPEAGFPEWVEIYNNSEITVDLSGWKLEDVLTSPSTIYTFPPSSSLSPMTYLVLELSGSKLNNSGDGVTLKDAQNSVIDSMTYNSSERLLTWQKGDSLWCQTVETPGEVSGCPEATPTPTPTPTPTTISSPTPTLNPTPTTSAESTSTTPSPTPLPSQQTTQATEATTPKITITEVSPCPDDNKEWIEVYNPAGQTVTVENLTIIDLQNNHRSITGEVAPHAFAVFNLSSSILNNTGDSVTVLDDLNRELMHASYTACRVGETLSLFDDGWGWGKSSPLAENQRLESNYPDDSATATQSEATQITHSSADLPETSIRSLNGITTHETPTALMPANQLSQTLSRSSEYDLPVNLIATPSGIIISTQRSGSQGQPGPVMLASTQMGLRLPVSLVIMGGSLLVLAACFSYDSVFTYLQRLVNRLPASRSLGRLHLLPQRPIGTSQPGYLAT